MNPVIEVIQSNNLKAEIISCETTTGKTLYGAKIYREEQLVRFVPAVFEKLESIRKFVIKRLAQIDHYDIDEKRFAMEGHVFHKINST
jgi:hypothetical protein